MQRIEVSPENSERLASLVEATEILGADGVPLGTFFPAAYGKAGIWPLGPDEDAELLAELAKPIDRDELIPSEVVLERLKSGYYADRAGE